MKINVHAGHNPDGKTACGAVGIIKESTEARKVKNELIRLLRQEGHTVYDCTVNDGTSQSSVLSRIVAKCNAHAVDLDVSIHFNAGVGDKRGDGKTTGTEVLLYSASSKSRDAAGRILARICGLGYKNRGIKYRPDLAVLNKTKAPALLIECCFVDDKDDIQLYDYRTMAKAIAEGIINRSIKATPAEQETVQAASLYKVQCGAFASKSNAETLAAKLKKAGFTANVVKG